MNKQVRDLLKTVYAQSVDIESSRSISGGCINQTLALTLSNGETVFSQIQRSSARWHV